jgi:hypothetical protein
LLTELEKQHGLPLGSLAANELAEERKEVVGGRSAVEMAHWLLEPLVSDILLSAEIGDDTEWDIAESQEFERKEAQAAVAAVPDAYLPAYMRDRVIGLLAGPRTAPRPRCRGRPATMEVRNFLLKAVSEDIAHLFGLTEARNDATRDVESAHSVIATALKLLAEEHQRPELAITEKGLGEILRLPRKRRRKAPQRRKAKIGAK